MPSWRRVQPAHRSGRCYSPTEACSWSITKPLETNPNVVIGARPEEPQLPMYALSTPGVKGHRVWVGPPRRLPDDRVGRRKLLVSQSAGRVRFNPVGKRRRLECATRRMASVPYWPRKRISRRHLGCSAARRRSRATSATYTRYAESARFDALNSIEDPADPDVRLAAVDIGRSVIVQAPAGSGKRRCWWSDS